MDSVDNSSGAPPTAATVMRLFPESNLGKPLMKRFLAEMVAANVDEESITAFLAMAAEFSISTKSSPASADFKEAREHLTATVKYFIELAAEAGAAGGANASVPAASPPVPATDKPAALKTPAAGAKRPSDATGGGGAAPKKANVPRPTCLGVRRIGRAQRVHRLNVSMPACTPSQHSSSASPCMFSFTDQDVPGGSRRKRRGGRPRGRAPRLRTRQ